MYKLIAKLYTSFQQKNNAAEIFSISVYVPLSDNVLTINVPEKIVSCIYDPIGDEFSDIQQLEDRYVNKTNVKSRFEFWYIFYDLRSTTSDSGATTDFAG